MEQTRLASSTGISVKAGDRVTVGGGRAALAATGLEGWRELECDLWINHGRTEPEGRLGKLVPQHRLRDQSGGAVDHKILDGLGHRRTWGHPPINTAWEMPLGNARALRSAFRLTMHQYDVRVPALPGGRFLKLACFLH